MNKGTTIQLHNDDGAVVGTMAYADVKKVLKDISPTAVHPHEWPSEKVTIVLGKLYIRNVHWS